MQRTIEIYDSHKSQRERILSLLRLNGYAYTKDLIGLGIYQYNARIKELRDDGHNIVSCKLNGCFGFEIQKNSV